jgi:hypothetical protein
VDSLTNGFMEKYPALTDYSAYELAFQVKTKADAEPANREGKKYVTLSREEIEVATAPQALAVSHPDVLDQLVADLK